MLKFKITFQNLHPTTTVEDVQKFFNQKMRENLRDMCFPNGAPGRNHFMMSFPTAHNQLKPHDFVSCMMDDEFSYRSMVFNEGIEDKEKHGATSYTLFELLNDYNRNDIPIMFKEPTDDDVKALVDILDELVSTDGWDNVEKEYRQELVLHHLEHSPALRPLKAIHRKVDYGENQLYNKSFPVWFKNKDYSHTKMMSIYDLACPLGMLNHSALAKLHPDFKFNENGECEVVTLTAGNHLLVDKFHKDTFFMFGGITNANEPMYSLCNRNAIRNSQFFNPVWSYHRVFDTSDPFPDSVTITYEATFDEFQCTTFEQSMVNSQQAGKVLGAFLDCFGKRNPELGDNFNASMGVYNYSITNDEDKLYRLYHEVKGQNKGTMHVADVTSYMSSSRVPTANGVQHVFSPYNPPKKTTVCSFMTRPYHDNQEPVGILHTKVVE